MIPCTSVIMKRKRKTKVQKAINITINKWGNKRVLGEALFQAEWIRAMRNIVDVHNGCTKIWNLSEIDIIFFKNIINGFSTYLQWDGRSKNKNDRAVQKSDKLRAIPLL